MKLVLTVFLVLVLSGCATAPKGALLYDEAGVGLPDENKSVIVVYRKVVPPLMYSVKVSIDDNLLTTLPNNSFTWTYLTPGEYKVKVSWPLFATTPSKKMDLNVKAGEYYFIEFGGQFNVVGTTGYSTHDMGVLDTNVGLIDVKSCCVHIKSNF